MTEVTISSLQGQKQALERKANLLSIECQRLVAEEYRLRDDAEDEQQEYLSERNSNILVMEQEVNKLDHSYRSGACEKKKIKERIREFQNKKEQLTKILKLQTAKLDALLKENQSLEDLIKIAREEYEGCQEEIYDLTIKTQNLMKYGVEIIPQEIVCHLRQKEGLQKELSDLDQQLQEHQDEVSRMISKDQILELQDAISCLEKKVQFQREVEVENQKLRQNNIQLLLIKIEYEENPNLEIKTLEKKLQDEENRVTGLQKINGSLKKKNKECVQKINEYQKYLAKEQIKQEDNVLELQKDKKEKIGRSKKKQKKGEKSIYEEIREDFQRSQGKENIIEQIKNSCLQKEIENVELDPEGRTFKKIKKISILELIVVMGMIIWSLFFYQQVSTK